MAVKTHKHTHKQQKLSRSLRYKREQTLYFTHSPTHIQQQNPKNRKAHTNSMVRMGVSHAQMSESQESDTLQKRRYRDVIRKAHMQIILACKLMPERACCHHTSSPAPLLCCSTTVAMDKPHIHEMRRPTMM